MNLDLFQRQIGVPVVEVVDPADQAAVDICHDLENKRVIVGVRGPGGESQDRLASSRFEPTARNREEKVKH